MLGNVYYTNADKSRRWVIYNGPMEASRVEACMARAGCTTLGKTRQWAKPLVHKAWEKPHTANLTGTAAAYAPAGSLRRTTPAARSDYEAWTPE